MNFNPFQFVSKVSMSIQIQGKMSEAGANRAMCILALGVALALTILAIGLAVGLAFYLAN